MHSWVLRNRQRLEAIYNLISRPRRQRDKARRSAQARSDGANEGSDGAGGLRGTGGGAARATTQSALADGRAAIPVRVVLPAPRARRSNGKRGA